jgi:gas vesicle protein
MSTWPRLLGIAVLIGTVSALSAAPDTGTAAPAKKASKASSLSPEEMAEQAKVFDTQLKDDYRYVLSLRELAKKQKDVIKLSCVNDKLVQLKVQLNMADEQGVQLRGAIDAKTDTRVSLYDSLAGTADAVKRLREEATGCLGEPELFKQEAGVDVTKPEIVDDPTVIDPYGVPEGGVVEPPGYASPFN